MSLFVELRHNSRHVFGEQGEQLLCGMQPVLLYPLIFQEKSLK